MNFARPLAAGLVAAMTLVACGGSSDPSGSSEDAAAVPTLPTAGGDDAAAVPTLPTAGDGVPTPTLDPSIPAEYLPGVGPVAVVGDALPTLPETGPDPAVGMSVPVLVADDFDGRTVVVDPAASGPTWVIFLAHWCPHCNDEIPRINELRDAGEVPDVGVVAVTTATDPGRPNFPPGDWLDDRDWTYPAIADGIDTVEQSYIAAAAYGVTSFPFSILVDGDGTVIERWSGERTTDQLRNMLTDAFGDA